MDKLSIIIPTYNEEKTIISILERINKVKLSIEKEIVIVDDGSKDDTEKILKKHKNLYSKLIKKKNGGKGSAIRLGFKKSTGSIIIIQDADLEYFPEEYEKIITPILKKETDVVYGSRFKGRLMNKKIWKIPEHIIANKFLSLLTSVLFFRHITDMETCYKCLSRTALNKITLKENDFRIEPEITTQLIKNKLKIKEVPIKYHPRTFKEGKKIGWKDGFKAIYALLKYRTIY